jgi:hypothetical protein
MKIGSAGMVALLLGANCAHGSIIYTLQIVADNDWALFGGTATSVTSLIYQNNAGWPGQISAASSQTFSLQPGETVFYLLGMGGGGQENISGTVNGVDITSPSVHVLMSSDLSSQLTGYDLGAVAAGTYDASLADVQAAFAGLTWGPPVLNTTDTVIVLAAPNQIGFDFADSTAHLFQFSAAEVSGGPGVPEPSTWWLTMTSVGAILLWRSRRTSSLRI